MDPDPPLRTQILQLELRLLQAEVRRSGSDLAALLADEFREFGGSGRVYRKDHVIEALRDEAPQQTTLADFEVMILSEGVILATYCASRRGPSGEERGRSLRSSIWKWLDGRWQMVFHQGTPSAPGGA